MRIALLIAFTLAGCVPPQQQPSYFQAGNGQAPPGGAPPPTAGAPPPVAASASCQDTLNCYGQCNPMTDACVGACDQRTTPESSTSARAVLTCMAQSGCQDQNCVVQQCGTQITTCTNITLAAAPSAPASAQPSGGGGGGCEDVMQPEYSYGSLVIPPPKCNLTQADFTGEWDSGAGAGESYYDSSGNNTGWSAVSTADHLVIDANGGFRDDWKGATTNSGSYMAHGTQQTSTGTFILDNNGNYTVTMYRAAHGDIKARTEHYIVVGWFVGPSEVTMTLQGPFPDPVTQQNLDDAHRNSYMNEKYHRKR